MTADGIYRDAGAGALLVAEARLRLADRLAFLAQCPDAEDDPVQEGAFHAAQPNPELRHVEARLLGPEGAAWQRLVTLFGLDQGEAGLLALSIAAALEPALGPMIAQAQKSRQNVWPTEALVRRLYGLGEAPVLRANSRLRFWHLLRPAPALPGEPSGHAPDPVLADWMTGHLAIDADLAYFIRPHKAGLRLPLWPVDEMAHRLGLILDRNRAAALLIEGQPGQGQLDFAAHLAAKLGHGLVVHQRLENDLGLRVRLERFALFAQAALFGPLPDSWPEGLPPAPLRFVVVPPGAPEPAIGPALALRVSLPEPDAHARRQAWQAAGGAEASFSPALERARLDDIEHLAASCPASAEETKASFARLCQSRLGAVGQQVYGNYAWDDLVLPEALMAGLRAYAFEARHRADALAHPETSRLFRAAAGLSALFSGGPGTGKTMAAQIIASELGVPLLRIDLAHVSSKYVGETAKNLSTAFEQARAAAAALFFDEADALFAKRTEGQDSTGRYANADTGHLLQLLEAHEGVVILATNRRGALDPAFLRRHRHVFEFPRPDAALRLQIWQKLLCGLGEDPARFGEALAGIAAQAELSAAQIKSALMTARYDMLRHGGPLELKQIEAAIAQEYAKEGRTTTAQRTERRARR